MKFPTTGQWKVDHSTDRGLDLYSVKNLNFDKKAYAALAEKVIVMFNEDDESDFGTPMAMYNGGSNIEKIATDDEMMNVTIDDPEPSVSQDSSSNVPSPSFDSSGTIFNGKWFVSETGDLNSYDIAGGTWTDEAVTLQSQRRHPLCVHRGNNTLLVGNGAQVKQYNTSIAETTNLTIPAGLEVWAIAYNASFAAIVTWDETNQEAFLFIWDGATSAANYSYPLGSNRAYFVAAYKNTFVTLTGTGQLLYWTADGLQPLAAMPSSFTTGIMGDVDDLNDLAFDTSVLVTGDIILFNTMTKLSQRNSEPSSYNHLQPMGVWCYDPAVGDIYHRYAPSGVKLVHDRTFMADVNIATDEITLTSAPETGTEIMYVANNGTPIDGLLDLTMYYAIKISSTVIKLAETLEDANNNIAIDLTSTGSDLQIFWIFLSTDFGQLYTNGGAMGAISQLGPSFEYSIFSEYGFGGDIPTALDYSNDIGTFCVVSRYGENRGWAMTQKLFSPNVTEEFQAIVMKAKGLKTELDKVLVKYRVGEDNNTPLYYNQNSYVTDTNEATWLSSNSFTTTLDMTNIPTGIKDGYEVEFYGGAGSGYLAHILSALDNGSGLWTVTIDENIKNLTVGSVSQFVIDNWKKLRTADGAESMTNEDDPNFVTFPIADNGKFIQFKFELRGRDVAIEEYELLNASDQIPA